MGWLIFIFIVIAIIIGVSAVRANNTGYRLGSGMFKSSEFNLDEKDDFSEKEYYDKHGLFK
ncbi:MAG TPA: hypothetical protein DEO32_05780 [Ruminococcaceae bacterium]|nr:hypothetical protein [Oscillospiraceae bacterium]